MGNTPSSRETEPIRDLLVHIQDSRQRNFFEVILPSFIRAYLQYVERQELGRLSQLAIIKTEGAETFAALAKIIELLLLNHSPQTILDTTEPALLDHHVPVGNWDVSPTTIVSILKSMITYIEHGNIPSPESQLSASFLSTINEKMDTNQETTQAHRLELSTTDSTDDIDYNGMSDEEVHWIKSLEHYKTTDNHVAIKVIDLVALIPVPYEGSSGESYKLNKKVHVGNVVKRLFCKEYHYQDILQHPSRNQKIHKNHKYISIESAMKVIHDIQQPTSRHPYTIVFPQQT